MNEIRFYSSFLRAPFWTKGVQRELEPFCVSTDYYPEESRMSPLSKFKRAVLKAAVIGRNLKYESTLPVHSKDWIEVLDPLHRYGLHLQKHFALWEASLTDLSFQKWFSLSKETETIKGEKNLFLIWTMSVDKNSKSFEEWLKEISNPSSVTYMDAFERKAYLLRVENGVLLQKDTPIACTSLEKFIFILDHKNTFYGGIYKKGKFHHSSFQEGAAVKGAGEFGGVANGRFTEIIDKTGHYNDETPKGSDSRMWTILYQFHSKGVDLTGINIKMNVHPTAQFTPFACRAIDYLKESFQSKDWYGGKIQLETAASSLLENKKKFIVRQKEYPLKLNERHLSNNLLSIDSEYPPFEIVWVNSQDQIACQNIYFVDSCYIIQANFKDSTLTSLIEKWTQHLGLNE